MAKLWGYTVGTSYQKEVLTEEESVLAENEIDQELKTVVKGFDSKAKKLEKQAAVLLQKWVNTAVLAEVHRKGIDGYSIDLDTLKQHYSLTTGEELEDASRSDLIQFGIKTGLESGIEFLRDKEIEFFTTDKVLLDAFRKAIQKI